jgi:hypothetical protein
LLLPFIFVFFVIVFPLWGVTLAVLGTLLLVVRGADWLARRAGVSALSGASLATFRAFRWVLTFGGLSNRPERQSRLTVGAIGRRRTSPG